MSTPTVTRRERLKADTRTEILGFARQQVDATGELSMREIGRQIGITAPGLYRYFPSIGALEEVIAREIALVSALAIDGGGWPAYVEWVADNPMLFRFLAKHPVLLAELHAAVGAA